MVTLALALDVAGLVLAAAAAACAWRSCRWLTRVTGVTAEHEGSGPEVVVAAGSDGAPLVSLLVPARDEEGNIGPCLQGLLAQRHPCCEILVLDDGSSDRTAAIARGLLGAGATPRGRVVEGRKLPGGWSGKNFACHQLAGLARGDWLFFLDADTRLAPGAVGAALDAVSRSGAEVASFLPRYAGAHWTNRLVVPWLYFFLTALVPLPEVRRLAHPRLAVANGQALLFRRDAYARSGGHAAIRDHVVEDVSLAIAVKRAGLGLALLDGRRWLACEMYDGVRALVGGFAKSFHSAARHYPVQWGALLTLLLLIGVRPWLRLAAGATGLEAGLALATLALVTATFAGLLRRFRQSAAALAVWPPALWLLVAVALGGGLAGLCGRELRWRGRVVGGEAPS